MFAEITKEAFNKIVSPDTPLLKSDELEHALKEYFVTNGVLLLMIHNYVSSVTQYYIQDINS